MVHGKLILLEYIVAVFIRYWLFKSDYNDLLSSRVEVSTPLNAWKRVVEGVSLYNEGINPYIGDIFHETPLVLWLFSWLTKNVSETFIDIIFIALDLLTSLILFRIAKKYTSELFQKQEQEKSGYAADVDEALLKKDDIISAPLYVLSAYLFNPYCVLNCVAKTTTVLSNLLLSIVFYAMIHENIVLCCLSLALCTLQSLYPIVLIVPLCIYIHQKGRRKSKLRSVLPILYFAAFFAAGIYICHRVVGDFSFADSTFNFILNVPDLKPNIGLFWYFFTEMFEHFRPLFLCSFQINATILYLFALSIRLKKEPILLAVTLVALNAVFKSYPSVGDVGFYLALLPTWKHLFQFMQQGFIVTCFFVGCSAFAPTVWHLWIYSGSANANFYFGVTLAFATTQIFLVTDLLFAYIKREFMLKHGITRSIGGKDCKLVLD